VWKNLDGAGHSGKKRQEMGRLRQVTYAWRGTRRKSRKLFINLEEDKMKGRGGKKEHAMGGRAHHAT